MADPAASVLARLKTRAKERSVQLQLLLNLFCQEEFLRRISNSAYSDHLVLKGGLLLYSLSGFESRPTMDADYLLRRHDNDVEKVVEMVQRIIEVPSKNDFIQFTVRDAERISEHREYNGVRVNLIGVINPTRTPFSVDFGIGDVVVPKALNRRLPVLLPDFEQPEVLTYSLESTIAEKFDAILSRMELTSRMKDFFDIYYLASTYEFEGRKLQEAIHQTLENRRTDYAKNSLERISQFHTSRDMVTKWNSFSKKTLKLSLDLADVLNLITIFLTAPFTAVLNDGDCFEIWNKDEAAWVKNRDINQMNMFDE